MRSRSFSTQTQTVHASWSAIISASAEQVIDWLEVCQNRTVNIQTTCRL